MASNNFMSSLRIDLSNLTKTSISHKVEIDERSVVGLDAAGA